jgi:DNA-binding NarL/FixJ family response regulator
VASSEARIAIVGESLVTKALASALIAKGVASICFADLASLREGMGGAAGQLELAVVDAEEQIAGPAAAAELRKINPELRLVLLCSAVSPGLARCTIEQHIEGVVLKSDGIDEAIVALRHVLGGRSVLPAGWHIASSDITANPLSARERQVLDLVAAGLSNQQVAERLVISVNTVKFHLRSIYASLGVRNRVEAILLMNAHKSAAPS